MRSAASTAGQAVVHTCVSRMRLHLQAGWLLGRLWVRLAGGLHAGLMRQLRVRMLVLIVWRNCEAASDCTHGICMAVLLCSGTWRCI